MVALAPLLLLYILIKSERLRNASFVPLRAVSAAVTTQLFVAEAGYVVCLRLLDSPRGGSIMPVCNVCFVVCVAVRQHIAQQRLGRPI